MVEIRYNYEGVGLLKKFFGINAKKSPEFYINDVNGFIKDFIETWDIITSGLFNNGIGHRGCDIGFDMVYEENGKSYRVVMFVQTYKKRTVRAEINMKCSYSGKLIPCFQAYYIKRKLKNYIENLYNSEPKDKLVYGKELLN